MELAAAELSDEPNKRFAVEGGVTVELDGPSGRETADLSVEPNKRFAVEGGVTLELDGPSGRAAAELIGEPNRRFAVEGGVTAELDGPRGRDAAELSGEPNKRFAVGGGVTLELDGRSGREAVEPDGSMGIFELSGGAVVGESSLSLFSILERVSKKMKMCQLSLFITTCFKGDISVATCHKEVPFYYESGFYYLFLGFVLKDFFFRFTNQ